jgi:hypothetical protein
VPEWGLLSQAFEFGQWPDLISLRDYSRKELIESVFVLPMRVPHTFYFANQLILGFYPQKITIISTSMQMFLHICKWPRSQSAADQPFYLAECPPFSLLLCKHSKNTTSLTSNGPKSPKDQEKSG